MVKLTESMIHQRTKKSDLQSIRKLNCCVNQISTLEDFSYCTSLEELYLRKNNISDLDEVYHLQDLPKLRILWLADNPCAMLSDYRSSVLRILPNLQILDNQAVTSREVRRASWKASEEIQQSIADVSQSESTFDSASAFNILKSGQSSNILQAILSLIHELDHDSLEIVDDAVRNLLQVP